MFEREGAIDALLKVLRAQADERGQRMPETESGSEMFRMGLGNARDVHDDEVRMHLAAAGLATRVIGPS